MSDVMMMLLLSICEERLPYPWDVMEVELGEDFVGDDAELEGDFGDRTLRFYQNLDYLFAPTLSIQERLADSFGTVMPLDKLTEILKTYQNIVGQSLPKGERLRQGLLALLPQWSPDDLGLLMRPHVAAFRGGASVLPQMPEKSWELLSEFERAQMVVAIAHFVVTELDELTEE